MRICELKKRSVMSIFLDYQKKVGTVQKYCDFSMWKTYPDNLTASLFALEYPQLRFTTYVDHAGATVYSTSQIKAYANLLTNATNVPGNPHSNPQTDPTSQIRIKILEYFGVNSSTHSIIFNSGATAGLKTIGETFPWTSETHFLHTTECHTSVLGIREYAITKNSTIETVPMDNLSQLLESQQLRQQQNQQQNQRPDDQLGASNTTTTTTNTTVKNKGLLAFPAECNFSGNRSNLDMVETAKQQGWYVLLDAAKYVSTSSLDLSKIPADFVAVSFYKMFGFPTGLGALIVRNDSITILNKVYFGGGTLAAASSESYCNNNNNSSNSTNTTNTTNTDYPSTSNTLPFHQLVDNPSKRFEDGTINFLSIQSIPYGLNLLQSIGMNNISKHVCKLSLSLSTQLSNMNHIPSNNSNNSSNSPVCIVYGRPGDGSIVAFNVLRMNGTYVGYSHVNTAAISCNIQLRTGCFCNPGACQIHLNMNDGEAKKNYKAGHVCSDDVDMIDGKPTGAVRVSFGYTSTMKDVDIIVSMIRSHFQNTFIHSIQTPSTAPTASAPTAPTSSTSLKSLEPTLPFSTKSGTLPSILSVHVYPIKSCDGIHLTNVGDCWSFNHSGLQYDREWAVVAPSPSASKGSQVWRVLRQKDCPDLCLIRTAIDWKGDSGRGTLVVTCQSHSIPLCINLTRPRTSEETTEQKQQQKQQFSQQQMDLLICGRRCADLDANDVLSSCKEEANVWFTKVLKRTCRLVRMPPRRSNTDNNNNNNNKVFSNTLQQRNGGIGFSNEQQLLLINTKSVQDLQSRLLHLRTNTGVIAPMVTNLSFRPNIVMNGLEPFEENKWKEGDILNMMNQSQLYISKTCVRCSMVNRDPTTGGSIPDVLHSLSTCYVQDGGTVTFGRYLRILENKSKVIEVGSSMQNSVATAVR